MEVIRDHLTSSTSCLVVESWLIMLIVLTSSYDAWCVLHWCKEAVYGLVGQRWCTHMSVWVPAVSSSLIMLPGNYGVLLVASDSKSDLCLFLVSIQNATFSFWTYLTVSCLKSLLWSALRSLYCCLLKLPEWCLEWENRSLSSWFLVFLLTLVVIIVSLDLQVQGASTLMGLPCAPVLAN